MSAKLPLPKLEDSINSYLEALKPTLTVEEFEEEQAKWKNIPKDSALFKIQNQLEHLNKSQDCYLDLFSNVRNHNVTNIYSEYRGSTLPKNPYFIMENDPNYWSLLPPDQVERASILTFSTIKFIHQIRNGTLKPDSSPRSGTLLSMKSYSYLFGSTRYPSAKGHGINVRNYTNSEHLIILHKKKFYYLRVLNKANEILVGQQNLKAIFDEILNDSEEEKNPSIASLTTESLENWKKARTLLEADPVNAENLKLIDSALLIVNLDQNEYKSEDDSIFICHGISDIDSHNGTQRGSCNSRWYDKLQLIISKNSIASVVWEPTSNDANVVLRYVSDIYTDSILRLARDINGSEDFSLWAKDSLKYNFRESVDFKKLEWLYSNQLINELRLSENRLSDLLCKFDRRLEIIEGRGLKFAKNLQVNVDSMIQLAIQLTHYALYGKIVPSCESVSTRKFVNSRSEMCFIQNPKIEKIAQTFISDEPNNIKAQLLLEGIENITNNKHKCQAGSGFEKHFKALKLAYLQRSYLNSISGDFATKIPDELDFEKDPCSKILQDKDAKFHNFFDIEILAVNCGNPSLKAFGLTPYKPNGFGIGYIIKDDHTVFTIASNFRQNSRFLDTLRWVLKQFESLIKLKKSERLSTTEMIKSVSMTLSESLNTLASDNSEHNSSDILGGYGYFDVGELEFRSFNNSKAASRVHSSLNLRTES